MTQEEMSFYFANACYVMSIANGLGEDEVQFAIDSLRSGLVDKSGFVKDAAKLSGLKCTKISEEGTYDLRNARFVVLELDCGRHFCRLLDTTAPVSVGGFSDGLRIYDPSRSRKTGVITGLRVFE